MKNKNCFYCDKLGGSFDWGNCAFCGKKSRPVNVPLYKVNYFQKVKYFCCQCAYLRQNLSGEELAEEEQWYQNQKKYAT